MITLSFIITSIISIVGISIYDWNLYKKELEKFTKEEEFDTTREKIKGFIPVKPVAISMLIITLFVGFFELFVGYNFYNDKVVINEKQVVDSKIYWYPPFSSKSEYSSKEHFFILENDTSFKYYTKDSFEINFKLSVDFFLTNEGYIHFSKKRLSDKEYVTFINNQIRPKIKEVITPLFIQTNKEYFLHYPHHLSFIIKNKINNDSLYKVKNVYLTDLSFHKESYEVSKKLTIEIKNEKFLEKKLETQKKIKDIRTLEIETLRQKALIDSLINELENDSLTLK